MFIASHSLFLLRELEVLFLDSEFREVSRRYFSLVRDQDDNVVVEQGDTVEDVNTMAMVDEELEQSDRYLEGSNNSAD